MPKHIGIVACSAEGAALCYRTICAEAPALLGPHSHPEITMHTPSLAEYISALNAGDLDAVADLMLHSANILANAGSEVLICPDNTIHQAMGRIADRSPLPWLHIAEEVAAEAARLGLRNLAILGTASLVKSEVYPEALSAHGILATRPDTAAIAEIDRIIFEELVPGHFLAASRAKFSGFINDLKDAGCDGIVLGCTEIPLLIGPSDSVLPILDSTRLLARAALEHACRS